MFDYNIDELKYLVVVGVIAFILIFIPILRRFLIGLLFAAWLGINLILVFTIGPVMTFDVNVWLVKNIFESFGNLFLRIVGLSP